MRGRKINEEIRIKVLVRGKTFQNVEPCNDSSTHAHTEIIRQTKIKTPLISSVNRFYLKKGAKLCRSGEFINYIQ